MSFKVTALVETVRLPKTLERRPVAKLVLLALAKRCDDDGDRAWPSLQTIAEDAEVSRHTARRTLADLRALGLIHVSRRASRHRPTAWRLDLPALINLSNPDPWVQSAIKEEFPDVPAVVRLKRPSDVPAVVPLENLDVPNSSLEVSGETVRGTSSGTRSNPDPVLLNKRQRTRALTRASGTTTRNGSGLWERFDAFWEAYPKHVGKQAARKVWQKLRPNDDLTYRMLAALEWQRTQHRWLKEGGQFVPNPATYLNAARWEDEPNTTPYLSKTNLNILQATTEFAKSS